MLCLQVCEMPPRDNWYPNVTDQPAFYWAYCQMIEENLFAVNQLHEESEILVDGEDTDSDDEEEEDDIVYVPAPIDDDAYIEGLTYENPIDLTMED